MWRKHLSEGRHQIRGLIREANRALDECERTEGVPFAQLTLAKALEVAAKRAEWVDNGYLDPRGNWVGERKYDTDCELIRALLVVAERVLDKCEEADDLPHEFLILSKLFSVAAIKANNRVTAYDPSLEGGAAEVQP
jgi:hypothetical protein